MNKNKILIGLLGLTLGVSSCKKDLDISNPNQPTPESAASEIGVLSLGQGGIYRNGFYDLKTSDGVYGRFWSGATGFHEMMGDIIGVEAANAYINQIGCPNSVTTDAGTVILNPSAVNTQYALLRSVNKNAQGGGNPTYYEWAYMYNLITSANTVLDLANKTSFSGGAAAAATKLATVTAWCNFWKGYAYSRIGSIYYAGLINNGVNGTTNANFVTKEAIIAEATACFQRAETAINAATSVVDYTATLGSLIPAYQQIGKGTVPSQAAWIRNINTLRARNILVNTLTSALTPAQLTQIQTLTTAGITASDPVFTGRTDANGDFLGTTIADKVQSTSGTTNTYKLSERLVQEFYPGDNRRTQNVRTLNAGVGNFNQDRGNSFNTRWTLFNGGNNVTGTIIWSNTGAGANEITLCGSYEENALMRAESLIRQGGAANIDAGTALIDAVRTYQGAGLAAIATGQTQAAALEILRRERRIALAFKGLSFYDARRYDIIAPNRSRTGAILLSGTAGTLNTNATIVYGFLDYWDVPDNELAYNPAASGSAATTNPKQ
jgi:starch-binding outer membrane protein, SusD/RagB family